MIPSTSAHNHQQYVVPTRAGGGASRLVSQPVLSFTPRPTTPTPPSQSSSYPLSTNTATTTTAVAPTTMGHLYVNNRQQRASLGVPTNAQPNQMNTNNDSYLSHHRNHYHQQMPQQNQQHPHQQRALSSLAPSVSTARPPNFATNSSSAAAIGNDSTSFHTVGGGGNNSLIGGGGARDLLLLSSPPPSHPTATRIGRGATNTSHSEQLHERELTAAGTVPAKRSNSKSVALIPVRTSTTTTMGSTRGFGTVGSGGGAVAVTTNTPSAALATTTTARRGVSPSLLAGTRASANRREATHRQLLASDAMRRRARLLDSGVIPTEEKDTYVNNRLIDWPSPTRAGGGAPTSHTYSSRVPATMAYEEEGDYDHHHHLALMTNHEEGQALRAGITRSTSRERSLSSPNGERYYYYYSNQQDDGRGGHDHDEENNNNDNTTQSSVNNGVVGSNSGDGNTVIHRGSAGRSPSPTGTTTSFYLTTNKDDNANNAHRNVMGASREQGFGGEKGGRGKPIGSSRDVSPSAGTTRESPSVSASGISSARFGGVGEARGRRSDSPRLGGGSAQQHLNLRHREAWNSDNKVPKDFLSAAQKQQQSSHRSRSTTPYGATRTRYFGELEEDHHRHNNNNNNTNNNDEQNRSHHRHHQHTYYDDEQEGRRAVSKAYDGGHALSSAIVAVSGSGSGGVVGRGESVEELREMLEIARKERDFAKNAALQCRQVIEAQAWKIEKLEGSAAQSEGRRDNTNNNNNNGNTNSNDALRNIKSPIMSEYGGDIDALRKSLTEEITKALQKSFEIRLEEARTFLANEKEASLREQRASFQTQLAVFEEKEKEIAEKEKESEMFAEERIKAAEERGHEEVVRCQQEIERLREALEEAMTAMSTVEDKLQHQQHQELSKQREEELRNQHERALQTVNAVVGSLESELNFIVSEVNWLSEWVKRGGENSWAPDRNTTTTTTAEVSMGGDSNSRQLPPFNLSTDKISFDFGEPIPDEERTNTDARERHHRHQNNEEGADNLFSPIRSNNTHGNAQSALGNGNSNNDTLAINLEELDAQQKRRVRSFQANHLALADALQFVRAVNIRERKRRLECEEALRSGVEALKNSENREHALREELKKLRHVESENKKETYDNVEQHEGKEEPSEDRDALFLTFQSDLDRQRLHLLGEHEKEISVFKQQWELSDLKLREEIMRLEQSLKQLESENDELHQQQLLQQQEHADKKAKDASTNVDAAAASSELAEEKLLLLLRDRDLEIEDLKMVLTEANAKRASDEEEIASLESQLIETRARLSAIECAMETMITLDGKEKEREKEESAPPPLAAAVTKVHQEGEEEEREKEHLHRLLALERAAHQQAREEINRLLIDSAALVAADTTNKRETSLGNKSAVIEDNNGAAEVVEGEAGEVKSNWEGQQQQQQELEAIIKQHRHQIEEIEEERNILILSLKRKVEAISSLEMAVSDASRRIEETETALNASQEIRSNLEKRVAELSIEIREENEKQQQYQQADKEKHEQERQQQQQEQRCSELEEQIKLLHLQIEEKDAEISHFVRIIEDHDSMCTTLHTHIASLEDNEQKLTAEMLSTVAPLRESVAELQRSNEEAQHKALIASEALDSALKQVETEREAAMRERDGLEAIFRTEKERESATAAFALASLAAEKEGLDKEVRELRDRVRDLDERLAIETQQKERLEALNADAASTAASVQLLEQNILELKEALSVEKGKVAASEGEAQSLRSVCENTIAQLEAANAAASAEQTQREKEENQKNEEESRAKNDAIALLAELTSKSARLETEVFELREALAEAEARLNTVKSETDSRAEERRIAEIQVMRESLGVAHAQELASLESEWQARLTTAESRHAADTLKKVESLSESHTMDVKLLTDQLSIARDNFFTMKSELDAARKFLAEKDEASQRDEAKQKDDSETIAAREKENRSLLLAVSEKDEVISRLEFEMKDLLQQKISLAAQLADENAKRSERAEEEERRAQQQQSTITELEQRLLEQERSFAAEREALVSNLDTQHEKEMMDLVEKHKAEIETLSFSKANVDGALDAMQREKEVLEVAHNQAIEDLRRKFAEEDAAKGLLIADLTSRLARAEQESTVKIEAVRQETESKMQTLTADLERTIESQRNLLAERDEALLFLQNEMDAIKERVRVREETAARSRAAEVSQQESDLSLITKQKEELESDVKSLTAKIESLTKSIESATQLREAESFALTKLKQELEEASAEIAASRERALAAEEHSLELQQEIHALSRANEAIEAQFAAEVERNALAAVAAHGAKEASSNLLLGRHDSSDHNNNTSTSTATLSTSESNGFQKDEGCTPPNTPSDGGRDGHIASSAEDLHATAAAVAELLREVEAKNSEIGGLNAIVGELRDEFHRLHTQLRAVEDEDEVQKERIAELTEQLVEVEFERDQLLDKLASAARAVPARVQEGAKETHSMAEESAPTVYANDRVVELERAVVDLVAEKAGLEEALLTAQKERDELLIELEYAAVAVEEHLNASPAASPQHDLAKGNLDVGHLEATNNNVVVLQSPVAGSGSSASPNSILSPAPQAPPSHSSDCDVGKEEGNDPDFGEVVESAFHTHNDFVGTQLQPSYLGQEF